jgi:uncharacterized protein (DUF1800 family)
MNLFGFGHRAFQEMPMNANTATADGPTRTPTRGHSRRASTWAWLMLALVLLALVACGSGGGETTTPSPDTGTPVGANPDARILAEQKDELAALPADEPVAPGAVPVQMPTRSAVRFLNQATFGAQDSELASLRNEWRTGWLQRQFALPVARTHWDGVLADQAAWLAEDGTRTPQDLPNTVWDWAVWQAYLSSTDPLRKRVGYALSQIMVVSASSLASGGTNNPRLAAGYLDVLEKGAFGNLRQLLEDVSLNPAMGTFLSHRGNLKASYDSNGVAIRVPDENYAREVMQLFTIGTVMLNLDGTPQLSAGKPVETYVQSEVSNLARVFTGWDWQPASAGVERYRLPMRHIAANHAPEEKKFLGVTIPAGTLGPASLKIALDTLFNHPNVGPFIGRQLIQRLVTSNPSRDYVARVAARFNDNGSGVRGDMKAVVTQVLNDPEARTPLNIAQPAAGWGKLREPVQRFTQLARALNLTTPGELWFIPDLSSPATELGQSPLRAETVFNFYHPGYAPPQSGIAAQQLVAPEFELVNEVSVPGIVNFLQRFLAQPPVRMTLDYGHELPLADQPAALVASLNLRFANESLSEATRREITDTLSAMPAGTADQKLTRVRTALLMLMAAPDFITQK